MISFGYTPLNAQQQNAGVTLRPGDTVTVLAISDSGAWLSGRDYIVTIYFRDVDTHSILTKTVKFRG